MSEDKITVDEYLKKIATVMASVFPTPKEETEEEKLLRLRDQFFCAALTGLMSSAEYRSIYGSDGQETRRIAVLHAWKLADAMLAQRNKSSSEGK